MPKRTIAERMERLNISKATLARLAKVPPTYPGIGYRAPEYAVRAMRKVLIERELRERHWVRENRRIAGQRAVWDTIPDCPGKARLIELLGNAAWKLLDGGQCEEADMILFMMPESAATKLLDDFFDEDT